MNQNTRRGSVYILVLGVTTLVMTIGVGAALASRSALDRQGEAEALLQADAAARSALELALASLNSNPTRITGLTAGTLSIPTIIGGFVVAVAVEEGDGGTLGAHSDYDRLRITVLAERNEIRQYRSIIVEPAINPKAGEPLYRMIPGSYRIVVE